jgi:DNA-binding transcriptional MocR family regulator
MVSDSVRMLEKARSGTRVSMVMAAILQRIAGRSLTPGDKLPSIRSFAGTVQVSTSTVVAAYDRLVAEGVIQSRPRVRVLRGQPGGPSSVIGNRTET